jgi:hypothetical protein
MRAPVGTLTPEIPSTPADPPAPKGNAGKR